MKKDSFIPSNLVNLIKELERKHDNYLSVRADLINIFSPRYEINEVDRKIEITLGELNKHKYVLNLLEKAASGRNGTLVKTGQKILLQSRNYKKLIILTEKEEYSYEKFGIYWIGSDIGRSLVKANFGQYINLALDDFEDIYKIIPV